MSTPTASVSPLELLGIALEGLKKRAADTYRHDLDYLADWMKVESAGHAISALCRMKADRANTTVRNFLSHLEALDYAENSIRRRLTSIKSSINKLRAAGHTTIVIDVKRPQTDAPRVTGLIGVDDCEAMIREAEKAARLRPFERAPRRSRSKPSRDLAILLLIYDHAFWTHELQALRLPNDLDLVERRITVGDKLIIITNRAREALTKWVDARGNKPGPLFIRRDRDPLDGSLSPVRGRAINEGIAEIAHRAGVIGDPTALVVRQTAIAHRIFDLNWGLRDVQDFMRGGSIDSILRHRGAARKVGIAPRRTMAPAGCPVKLRGPGTNVVFVVGERRRKAPLTGAQYKIIRALVQAWPNGLTRVDLLAKCGAGSIKVLERLCENDQDWASVIKRPNSRERNGLYAIVANAVRKTSV